MKTNKLILKSLATFCLCLSLNVMTFAQNGIEVGPSSANGDHTIAAGDNATATANYSIAVGKNNQSNGLYSASFGESTASIGEGSLAFGFSCNSTGGQSFAGGAASTANGLYSLAFGLNNGVEAGAGGAISMGVGNISDGSGAITMGENNMTLGDASVAMGRNNIAHAFGETVFGTYCEEYTGFTESVSNVATDRLFVLGNGDPTTRSNALTILKSGNSGFGVSYPSEDIHVKGGVRVESSTNTPNPKTVYANSLPLAYGSFLFNGAITSDYGISSATKTANGTYAIVLDNSWTGVPAVNATVRFGGIVGQGITISHEFDAALKTIYLYFADANTGVGIDQAFSVVIYGQPVSSTGSGCAPITSPTSLLQAPNEVGSYYVTEDASCGCVTDIPFAFGGPSPNVLITVNDFVGGGTGTVNVDLEVISPSGGGASAANIDLTSAGASVNVGVYTGLYGNTYDTYIDLTYDGVQFVDATVRMVAL